MIITSERENLTYITSNEFQISRNSRYVPVVTYEIRNLKLYL